MQPASPSLNNQEVGVPQASLPATPSQAPRNMQPGGLTNPVLQSTSVLNNQDIDVPQFSPLDAASVLHPDLLPSPAQTNAMTQGDSTPVSTAKTTTAKQVRTSAQNPYNGTLTAQRGNQPYCEASSRFPNIFPSSCPCSLL